MKTMKTAPAPVIKPLPMGTLEDSMNQPPTSREELIAQSIGIHQREEKRLRRKSTGSEKP